MKIALIISAFLTIASEATNLIIDQSVPSFSDLFKMFATAIQPIYEQYEVSQTFLTTANMALAVLDIITYFVSYFTLFTIISLLIKSND